MLPAYFTCYKCLCYDNGDRVINSEESIRVPKTFFKFVIVQQKSWTWWIKLEDKKIGNRTTRPMLWPQFVMQVLTMGCEAPV